MLAVEQLGFKMVDALEMEGNRGSLETELAFEFIDFALAFEQQ